jgi:hypothetical protein
MIKTGVCAYFLILYSCMQILQKLWYSSAGDSLAWHLIPFAASALMLSGGIYLLKRHKKNLIAFPDNENPLISATVPFVGGWVILAWEFKNIVSYYLFVIISGPFDLKAYLFPLILYGLPLIAAVVTIKKGSLKNVITSSSERIAFLCLRIVLIFICVVSVYQILMSFGPFILFTPHELHPIEIRWIVSESVFAAAALILIFAPLRLKTNLKNTDGQSYFVLSRQSFTLNGYLVLIVGIAEICDALIRKYDFFDLFFFELKEFLVQLLPAVFLILVGLCFIYYGKKQIMMRRMKPR